MKNKIDCLLIGHNEPDFREYHEEIKKLGEGSGVYRNLDLSFLTIEGKPYTIDEIFNMYLGSPDADDPSFQPMDPIRQGETFTATIGYLGNFLHRHGHSFDYVNSFQEEKEQLAVKLTENDVLTVAITTTLYGAPLPILRIIEFVKKYNKTAKIIVGGPYVFTQYRAQEKMVLEYLLGGMKGVDFFIISSQGEGALANVIDALKNDLPLDTIHNLYYKTPEGFRFTPITQESNPMGEHMVDWGLFADGIGEHVNIRTSISCPFACAFCSFPDNAGQFQTASVADVERELDSLAALGTVKSIQFIDDTFNMPVKRAKNIMRMMIKNKYEFKWHCHLRCQYMDEESAQLMQESGCQGVFLGIETGSQSMLVNMNKRAKQPQYLKGMELLHKYGISTLGSFFIGFPGETPQTVRETIDFIEESEMDFYQIQQWYCDTTTPIWKKKDELQIKGSQFEWSHSSMDSKTAADLVEQFFMSIRKSVCVPRYNFDFDHLFHLLSRGMTMDQVKTFLNIFNRGLEEKLISLARHEVRPEIIGSFKEFSRSLHPTVKVGSLSSAAGAAVVG